MDFDKIVQKLWKKKGDIVSFDDIATLVEPDYPEGRPTAKRDAYKVCSRLVTTGRLLRVRNGIYYVPTGVGRERPVDIVDRCYWPIVRKIILEHARGQYVVGHASALALHLRDFSAPAVLTVYTRDVDRTVRIADDRSIRFVSLVSGAKTGRKNLFAAISADAVRCEIEGMPFKILAEEAAVLDALLVRTRDDDTPIDRLVEKFLRKYARYLDRAKLGKLVKLRYVTAINRLRELAKDAGYDDLYEKCLAVIREEGGGCFVSPPRGARE